MRGMEKTEVRDFLDTAIRGWRTQRDTTPSETHRTICMYYIDCLQQVREALIGTTLGEPNLTDQQQTAIRNIVEAHDDPAMEYAHTDKRDIDVLRELLLED